MSCENRVFTTMANVNKFIVKELGSPERFNGHETELIHEYQTMSQSSEYELLLSSSQEAISQMRSGEWSEVSLTEFGVTLTQVLRTYYYERHTQEQMRTLQKEFAERAIAANKYFFVLWEQLANKKRAQREKIHALSKETREKLDQNPYLLITLKAVVEDLKSEGFELLNPEILEIPVSQVLTKGVHVVAENTEGEQREVWLYLPGGKIKTAVHAAPDKDYEICKTLARTFAERVAEIIGEGSRSLGTPFTVSIGPGNPIGKSFQRNEKSVAVPQVPPDPSPSSSSV